MATYLIWAYPDEDKGKYMRVYAGPEDRWRDPLLEVRIPEGLKIDEDGTRLAMTFTPVEEM